MSDNESAKSSEHTDWAFVDDGTSQEADSPDPSRVRSPGRRRQSNEGFANDSCWKPTPRRFAGVEGITGGPSEANSPLSAAG